MELWNNIRKNLAKNIIDLNLCLIIREFINEICNNFTSGKHEVKFIKLIFQYKNKYKLK